MTPLTKAQIEAMLTGATPGWELLTSPDGTMAILTRNALGSPHRHIAEMSWAADEAENGLGDANLAVASPDLARTAIALHDRVAELERALREIANSPSLDDFYRAIARATLERTTP